MVDGDVGDRELRLALDHVPAYVYIKDAEGRYLYANRATLELFRRTAGDLPELHDRDIFSDETVHVLREVDRRVLAGERTQEELVTHTRSGERRVYLEVKSPMQPSQNDDTAEPRILGISTDVTDYKQLEEQLELAASTDHLTGLPNRRRLLERLELALVRSDRTRRYGCVVFLDVDGLKEVNDIYGHLAGDRLLVEVANRLRDRVRRSDHVARLGGDEFVVLAEDLGLEEQDARVRADLLVGVLRATVEGAYDLGDVEHRGSASLGCTLFLGLDRSVDEVLSAADTAMYAAKRARS